MPYSTQPNVSLTTAWTPIASGAAEVHIQNLGSDPVLVSIGANAPAAGSIDGNIVGVFGVWSFTGMTTETVYARASSISSSISVTRA